MIPYVHLLLFLEAAAREILEKVMADALLKSGSNRLAVRAVCLAVSGVNHPTDQQRLLNWLRDIFPSHVGLYVQNDAVAALASGTMGKLHGCVLIAGTGTIAYGFTADGREARAAGAGPVLGDWGSGYGIAAQALTAVIKAHDGRGSHTMLTSSVLEMLGLSSPDELIGWTYADPSWARIAALVPVVVSCAEAGDEVANRILYDSVHELASSVRAVVQRLGLCGEDGKQSFPLVMVGGVLEANKRWDIGKEVVKCISKYYPGTVAIRPKPIHFQVSEKLYEWASFSFLFLRRLEFFCIKSHDREKGKKLPLGLEHEEGKAFVLENGIVVVLVGEKREEKSKGLRSHHFLSIQKWEICGDRT
ncbi:hypothetical protein TIFTF001_001553 [Ficus carica]|uniref:N-acetyl-D-glucosamine kinase n=1 Tax=Ficus carica TaxID=3494 RepID=A0AA87ZGX1_FICCA|nr:hypothetical protein TIFTF001_001553 [Ficus carica]